MVFSEDSRVKIPCILHLVRLGYRYLSLKSATWDEEANIFPEIFHEAIARTNPGMESDVIERFLAEIKLSLVRRISAGSSTKNAPNTLEPSSLKISTSPNSATGCCPC